MKSLRGQRGPLVVFSFPRHLSQKIPERLVGSTSHHQGCPPFPLHAPAGLDGQRQDLEMSPVLLCCDLYVVEH